MGRGPSFWCHIHFSTGLQQHSFSFSVICCHRFLKSLFKSYDLYAGSGYDT